MPQNKFSALSLGRLQGCHIDLFNLMHAVLERQDITILCGHRGQAEQEAAFAAGNSKLHYPHGKHNAIPSKAVDIQPYPFSKDPKEQREQLIALSNIVSEEAARLQIPIRFGGDWDGNPNTPNKFDDLFHYEIKR